MIVLSLISWGLTVSDKSSEFYFDSEKNIQLWRFVSAHLVHRDTHHLTLNLLALWILVLSSRMNIKQLMIATLSLVCAFNVFLILCIDGTYAGLSSVIYGLLGIHVIHMWPLNRHASLSVTVIVLIYSFLQLSRDYSHYEIRPLTELHFLGFCLGVYLAHLMRLTLTPRPYPST